MYGDVRGCAEIFYRLETHPSYSTKAVVIEATCVVDIKIPKQLRTLGYAPAWEFFIS